MRTIRFPASLLPLLLFAGLAAAEPIEKLAPIAAQLEKAVAEKQVAGAVALVSQGGKVVYRGAVGWQDAEAKKRMTPDTIFRIASMTKPVTSVAAMILVEEGKLRLDDPVSKYIPEFADAKVLVVPEEKGAEPKTVPARREVTVRDLLTHTAGLTYRFFNRPHFGKLYADAGVSDGLVETPGTIADNARKLAKLPLVHHPGEGWEYGLNTDVLGRVIEVASGKTLDAFFRERIFEPLKMNDTHFVLPEEKRSRLAAVYTPGKDKTLRRVGKEPVREGELIYSATYPTWGESRYYSGGAGLVSTVGDYHRFLLMLLNGGELDGARVLKPETVREMTRNQIAELSVPFNAHGTGFGYGFGVVTDREKAKEVASEGTYSWGGFFYTYFWVDPKRELIGILMTQTYPNGHLKLRERFKELTYEALKAAPQ